jgi:PAS domain S-box-containing protein
MDMNVSPHGQTMFAGGGAMGALIAAHDWASTQLGRIEDWPETLVNAVSMILPASAEIVLFWGPDFVTFYNDAYATTIGTKHPGVLGRPAGEGWAELWDDLGPLLRHVHETGETFAAKERAFQIERAGFLEEVFFDVSYSAIRERSGAVGGILCIVAETTARVRAARAITEDRERLHEMFDSAPSFMAVLRGPKLVFELANRSYLQLIGEARENVIGKPIRDALPELAGQGYVELLEEVFASARPYRSDGARVTLRRTPDAELEERIVDFIFQPVSDATGAVTGVFVEGTDVTDRHATEAALDFSRESMELATEAAEIGTWDLDPRSGRLNWSDRTRRMWGVSPDVPITIEDFWAGVHPDDVPATANALARSLDPAERAQYSVEYRVLDPNEGTVRWIAARGRGFFVGDVCERAVGTVVDITAVKAQQEVLRESEERFRTLADSLPALVWIADRSGQVLFANRAFETMLGIPVETAMKVGWLAVIPPEHHALFEQSRAYRMANPGSYGGDLRVVTAAGESRWIHTELRPRMLAGVFAGYVGCAVDVTEAHAAGEVLERRVTERTAELLEQIAERERVEAELHQMQRLEAVGQLTSGVAHDFNNLLTVVLGNVPLIERAVRGANLDQRTLQRLDNVRSAAERGAALTAQLLAFSRRQRLEAKVLDLNATVEKMRELMRSSLGGSIAVKTDLATDLWPALVDPTQIELIILNLAINARDAMPDGGTLTISTANITLDHPKRPEEPASGDYACVSVTDVGTGMSEDVLAKAFEPFFTTKDVGKGSGLGLAQVFGFAKQSGGGVRLNSTLGEGTTVCVYLPRAVAAVADVPATAPPAARGSIAGRTILVLDDEDAVRAVTADALRDAGCRVIEAADGASALEALAVESVDLVVADFAMPGMTGARFADRAKARWPALPVIILTGYADLSAIRSVPKDRILQKPFASGAVLDLIARLLTEA